MSKLILVVEDQEDNRRIMRDLLASAGYEVMEAITGEEGVAAAESHRPDLILMDIQLSGLDGYEATRRLTSEEGFFATIALARYWPSNGKMQLALGGHLSPLWITEGGIRNLPHIEGISLGITPNVHYETKEILLSPGESMLFFTDGVVEAENKNTELFGNDRLVSYIKNTKGPPWGKGLLDLVSGWRGKASANDDLTILEIWRD
jgi:serine phosphatase RsbU (regulator of sigma subunit)